MPVEWSDESYFKKEMKKWDAPKREGGMNRDHFEEFPKMLYRTQANPLSGRHEIAVSQDVVSLDKTTVILDAQAFNASCQMTVGNREEEERAIRAGWSLSPAEAVEYHAHELDRLAKEAAHRGHDDRNMSERAKAEAAKVDLSTPSQVAEIPEQPKRKGWPKGKPRPKKVTPEPAV